MPDYQPLTTQQMLSKGYRLAPRKHEGPSLCRSCKVEVEWFISPNGKSIPFDPIDPGDALAPRICHFASCPNAAQHRGNGSKASSNAEPEREEIAAMEDEIRKEFRAAGLLPEDANKWLLGQLCRARIALRRNS